MTHNIDGVNTHQDAFDDAMEDPPSYFGGQVMVDAYTCVLVKGQGKVPYDPQTHQDLRTSTAITFNIAPLDPTRKMIAREMLNWVAEFKGVVRPSIEALAEEIATIKNLVVGEFNPLREVSQMFVVGEFVQKPDNKPGETYTTLAFKGVYGNMADCQAAYTELTGIESEDAAPVDPARESMAAFLPGLWTQANHDAAKFQELIRDNPMLSAHFDMASAEVKGLVNSDPSSEIPI